MRIASVLILSIFGSSEVYAQTCSQQYLRHECNGPCYETTDENGKTVGVCPQGLVTGSVEMRIKNITPDMSKRIQDILKER